MRNHSKVFKGWVLLKDKQMITDFEKLLQSDQSLQEDIYSHRLTLYTFDYTLQ